MSASTIILGLLFWLGVLSIILGTIYLLYTVTINRIILKKTKPKKLRSLEFYLIIGGMISVLIVLIPLLISISIEKYHTRSFSFDIETTELSEFDVISFYEDIYKNSKSIDDILIFDNADTIFHLDENMKIVKINLCILIDRGNGYYPFYCDIDFENDKIVFKGTSKIEVNKKRTLLFKDLCISMAYVDYSIFWQYYSYDDDKVTERIFQIEFILNRPSKVFTVKKNYNLIKHDGTVIKVLEPIPYDGSYLRILVLRSMNELMVYNAYFLFCELEE